MTLLHLNWQMFWFAQTVWIRNTYIAKIMTKDVNLILSVPMTIKSIREMYDNVVGGTFFILNRRNEKF